MFMSNKIESYKCKKENNIIVIDGIIGAGKTTLSQYLSERYDVHFYEELVNDEKRSLTQDMLDLFYSSPNRWSAITQIMFLSHRFKDLKDAEKRNSFCLFDRSIYGDEIFAYNLFKRNEMTDNEFQIYQGLLQPLLKEVAPPHLLIYLDVTVDIAMERIQERSRSTEPVQISRTYMDDLKKSYDSWFESFDLCEKVKLNFNSEGMTMETLAQLDACLR